MRKDEKVNEMMLQHIAHNLYDVTLFGLINVVDNHIYYINGLALDQLTTMYK